MTRMLRASRILLLVIAVFTIGGLLLWTDRDRPLTDVGVSAEEPDSGLPSSVPEVESERSALPVHDAEPEASTQQSDRDTAAADTSGEIRGEIRIGGARETDRSLDGGTLDILVMDRTGMQARRIKVPAIQGVFSFSVEPGETRCDIISIVLKGLPAEPVERIHELSPDRPLIVEARWSSGIYLHVLRSGTDIELDGIDVHAARVDDVDALLYPGTYPSSLVLGPCVFQDQPSPILVGPVGAASCLWIRARGYAWARVQIEGGSGERKVELTPEAILEVHIAQATTFEGDCTLDLASKTSQAPVLREELVMAAGTHRYEGLVPQTVKAALVTGNEEARTTLAEAELELRPGEVTEWKVADLDAVARSAAGIDVHALVHGDDVRETTATAVLLRSDASGHEARVARSIELRSTPGTNRFTGSARGLAPGRYDLYVQPWCARSSVVLVESRVETLVLDVRLPARLIVSVTDEGGTDIGAASVQYSPDPPTVPWASARRDEQQHVWTAVLQSGTVRVIARAPGRRSKSVDVSASEPASDVSIVLEKAVDLPLVLTFCDGDAKIPLYAESWVRILVESLDGTGRVTRRSGGSGLWSASATVHVSAAGRYRITVPAELMGSETDHTFECDVSEESGGTLRIDRSL